MSTYKKTFNIIEIADLHFGNGRVSAVREYEHLQTFLYPTLMDKETELLIINGDTFDTLLNMNSDAGVYVARFIDDLINLAIEFKFYIRVVRGTFSHDRHQNRFFLIKDKGKHELYGKPLVSVIDRIRVEYFESMNIHIAYCPDDQPHKDLTQAIIDVIDANHLDSVDLLCSHGYYDHLLPMSIPHIPHNTIYNDRIDKYVSGMMLNGHVHRSSVYRSKVISSGSFERFDHNTEDPVGFWHIRGCWTDDVDESGKKRSNKQRLEWGYGFIENTQAIPFKTFVADKYNDIDGLCNDINKYMLHLDKSGYLKTDPVYIRIVGNVDGVSSWLRDTYKNVIVSDKHTTVVQEVAASDVRTDSDELPVITEDNLAQMIFNNLPKECGMSLQEVEEIVNGL